MVQWLRICLPCRRHWFHSWSRKIPHAVEQLSPHNATSESPRTATKTQCGQKKKKNHQKNTNLVAHGRDIIAIVWWRFLEKMSLKESQYAFSFSEFITFPFEGSKNESQKAQSKGIWQNCRMGQVLRYDKEGSLGVRYSLFSASKLTYQGQSSALRSNSKQNSSVGWNECLWLSR